MSKQAFDKYYYENGIELGISLYENYRWQPELTIPICAEICEELPIKRGESVLDFGCAKGYYVKALRLLGRQAYGYDVSDYALRFCEHVADPFSSYADWIIAKDVLEHLTEDQLRFQLNNLSCGRLFIVVPLGDGKRFLDPREELDATHIIREPFDWWWATLEQCGYRPIRASTEFGNLKKLSKPGTVGFFVCKSGS